MLKKILIFILILIVALAGAYAFLYFTGNVGGGDGEDVERIRIQDLFPFGQPNTIPTPITAPNESEPQTTSTIPSQLRQIYSSPVAGAESFVVGSSTIIRFVEQSTGNMYEAYTDTTATNRISNTTIPKVAEAFFTTKDSVLMRYLNTNGELIETVFGSLSTSTPSTSTSTPSTEELFSELQTTFLFPNIQQLAVSPNKSKIFYTTEFNTGAAGILANPNGTSKTNAFESPIKEWLVEWSTTTVVTLTTKASAQTPGHLYFLNPNTGAQQQILRGDKNFTTRTNSNASFVLYSKAISGRIPTLHIYDVKTSSSTPITSISTLPEKCVWGKKDAQTVYCAVPTNPPQGEYPDVWYQGIVSFSDKLWKINTTTGESQLLVDLKEITDRDIDAFNLSLDPNETFVLFKNKTDLTLWSFTF